MRCTAFGHSRSWGLGSGPSRVPRSCCPGFVSVGIGALGLLLSLFLLLFLLVFRLRSLLLFVSFRIVRVSVCLLVVSFAFGFGRKRLSVPVLPVSFGFVLKWFVVGWVLRWLLGSCALFRCFGLWPLQLARLFLCGSV